MQEQADMEEIQNENKKEWGAPPTNPNKILTMNDRLSKFRQEKE